MARNTPFHLQRILLINGRHRIDLAVTRRAAYTLCHVNAMIKIYVLRKVVNALPLDRLVLAKARPDGLKIRAVVPQLAVAIHTRLRRRHTRSRSRFNRRMTVAAIDAVVPDVVFVTELNWLLFLEKLSGEI